jgi:hypothetical protein
LPDYLLGLRAGAAATATDPESAIESQRHAHSAHARHRATMVGL